MSPQEYKKVMVGDWVKLKSSKGELIHGYVEKTIDNNEVVQLRVVTSDNQFLSGQSIQVELNKVTLDQENEQFSVAEIKQLIDLALLTNDKAWFDSLMIKYQALKVKQN